MHADARGHCTTRVGYLQELPVVRVCAESNCADGTPSPSPAARQVTSYPLSHRLSLGAL